MSAARKTPQQKLLHSPVRALMAGQVPEEILFPFPEVSAEERARLLERGGFFNQA